MTIFQERPEIVKNGFKNTFDPSAQINQTYFETHLLNYRYYLQFIIFSIIISMLTNLLRIMFLRIDKDGYLREFLYSCFCKKKRPSFMKKETECYFEEATSAPLSTSAPPLYRTEFLEEEQRHLE
jgi:hypothetical protein